MSAYPFYGRVNDPFGGTPAGRYADGVLDELDKRIIRILQRNARVPNTEIGRALDVTETTIRNRVSRLLDEKLIEIVAVVDPKATDATISAFLLLTVSPPEIDAALDRLRDRTEVRYLSQVVGRGQVMAEAFFRDLPHLLGFQNEVLAALPGIGGVETLLVGQVHKLSYEWEI